MQNVSYDMLQLDKVVTDIVEKKNPLNELFIYIKLRKMRFIARNQLNMFFRERK